MRRSTQHPGTVPNLSRVRLRQILMENALEPPKGCPGCGDLPGQASGPTRFFWQGPCHRPSHQSRDLSLQTQRRVWSHQSRHLSLSVLLSWSPPPQRQEDFTLCILRLWVPAGLGMKQSWGWWRGLECSSPSQALPARSKAERLISPPVTDRHTSGAALELSLQGAHWRGAYVLLRARLLRWGLAMPLGSGMAGGPSSLSPSLWGCFVSEALQPGNWSQGGAWSWNVKFHVPEQQEWEQHEAAETRVSRCEGQLQQHGEH